MDRRGSIAIAATLAVTLCLVGCGAESSSPNSAAPPTAATPTPTPTPDARLGASFPFASSRVGDTFQIYVALPAQYLTHEDRYFPVVYLLDANWNFQAVRALVDTLTREGQMEPAILVSMCPVQALQQGYTGVSPARCRDLTPTALSDFPGSGHAANFAAFLRIELVPHIDACYRTRRSPDERALLGHSLAGLFTWYAVFHLDDVFHKFVPASASLFWDGHVMLQHEASDSRGRKDMPVGIYSTVSTGEGPDMVADRDQLVAILRGRGYPSLRLSTATYLGIDHDSSSGPAFREGLSALF